MISPVQSSKPRIALVLMTLIYAFNFMDRQVLSVLAEPIKRDLMLSDTQLGLLGGIVFALFYTVFGIPVAWVADRVRRVRVLVAACSIWSLCCAACGLAGNFTHLAIARVGVGLGEAGGVPPSYSLISDFFPKSQRARALAFFSLGVPLGLGLGAAMGGWISAYLGWRASLFAVGLPGLALALAFFLIVKEPQRGRHDAAGYAERPPLWTCVKTFYGTPAIFLPALSCAIGAIANLAVMAWLSAYLIRVMGMSLSQIGTYLSATIMVGMGIGIFASGWLVDHYSTRDIRTYAYVPAGAMALALPFFVLGLEAKHWYTALPLLGTSLGVSCAYLAPAITYVQNVLPPTQRSTGGALFLFIVNLVGLGGGPLYVGVISDWAKPIYGVDALRVAMMALVPFFILAVIANLISARVIRSTNDPRPALPAASPAAVSAQ